VILSDSVEREYSEDKGVEMIPLGLYMIKGDNMWVQICLGYGRAVDPLEQSLSVTPAGERERHS
jgi:hypothetical protein